MYYNDFFYFFNIFLHSFESTRHIRHTHYAEARVAVHGARTYSPVPPWPATRRTARCARSMPLLTRVRNRSLAAAHAAHAVTGTNGPAARPGGMPTPAHASSTWLPSSSRLCGATCVCYAAVELLRGCGDWHERSPMHLHSRGAPVQAAPCARGARSKGGGSTWTGRAHRDLESPRRLSPTSASRQRQRLHKWGMNGRNSTLQRRSAATVGALTAPPHLRCRCMQLVLPSSDEWLSGREQLRRRPLATHTTAAATRPAAKQTRAPFFGEPSHPVTLRTKEIKPSPCAATRLRRDALPNARYAAYTRWRTPPPRQLTATHRGEPLRHAARSPKPVRARH